MRHRSFVVAGAILASMPWMPAAVEGPRTIIVMDGSGSMWGRIEGRPKLEIAREMAGQVLGRVPAGQELGLLAYGHRTRGDCRDIELVVPPGPEPPARSSTPSIPCASRARPR